MGTVCFHALEMYERIMNPIRIFVRPDVARTYSSLHFFFEHHINNRYGPDHYVISTSPRYEDVSESCSSRFELFSRENSAEKESARQGNDAGLETR